MTCSRCKLSIARGQKFYRTKRGPHHEACPKGGFVRNYDLAKLAYDAYCKQTGGVSLISGDKLPDFWSLKDAIKDAWWAAAEAVHVPKGNSQ